MKGEIERLKTSTLNQKFYAIYKTMESYCLNLIV